MYSSLALDFGGLYVYACPSSLSSVLTKQLQHRTMDPQISASPCYDKVRNAVVAHIITLRKKHLHAIGSYFLTPEIHPT